MFRLADLLLPIPLLGSVATADDHSEVGIRPEITPVVSAEPPKDATAI